MQFDKPAILVVDQDPQFLKDLIAKAGSGVRVDTAVERKEAQLHIADKTKFYSALCFNTRVCDPDAVPLVRFAKVHRPATPVCLLLDEGQSPPPSEAQDKLHIHRVFNKPIDGTQLVNAIFPYTYFELNKVMELAAKDTTGADGNMEEADSGMHAISARDFLCGSKSFFDVFVKMAPGKYLKILRAGDEFDAERVKTYLQKNVAYFYMRAEAQELFLQYCDKLTEAILAKPDVDIGVKTNQVLNFGKETMAFLKKRGYNEMTLNTAAQFVTHTQKLTKDLAPSLLDTFLTKIALADHGTGTTMLVSLMLQELGFQDKKLRDVVALSAMYHDIGLTEMPEKFQDENMEEMTEDEKKDFEKHPIVGEGMVKSIRRINPLVAQVVLQHHERRTRKGFPNQLGPGAITPVAELVGIADTFNQLILRAHKDPVLDPLREIEVHYFDEFSSPVINAFQKVFFKK